MKKIIILKKKTTMLLQENNSHLIFEQMSKQAKTKAMGYLLISL